jgi:hypothetical protein
MRLCRFRHIPNVYIQPFAWRGLRQTRGLRSKARRVLSQFSPHDWTAFKWEGTASLLHYCTVVLLLTVFLAAELNPFYLKVGDAPFRPSESLTMFYAVITVDTVGPPDHDIQACVCVLMCTASCPGAVSVH